MSSLRVPQLPNKSLISAAVAMALSISAANSALAGQTRQNIEFETSGQNMWGLGTSTVIQENLFLGATWGEKYGGLNTSGSIFEVGTAALGYNGIKATGETNGKVGLDLGFNFDSGTVNSSLPFEFIFDLPDAVDLQNGQTFSMGIQSARLTDGAFLSTISPAFEAYADLVVKADASLNVSGCYDIAFDSGCGTESLQLLDLDESFELLSINRDNSGEARVLDGFSEFFAAGSTAAGLVKIEQVDDPNGPDGQKTEKVSLDLKPKVSIGSGPLVEVDVRLPNVVTKTTLSSGFSVDGSGADNVIAAQGSDNFIDINVDVDQIGTMIGVLPPLGVEADVDFGVGSVSAALDLVDLTLTPSLSLTQDFGLSIKNVDVRYVFDEQVNAGLKDAPLSMVTELAVDNLTDDIFVEWTDGQDLGITTIYDIAVEFFNDTGLKVAADFTVDLLKGSISGEVFGVDLGASSFGPLASVPFDLGETDSLSIYENTFELQGFGSEQGNKFLFSTDNVNAKTGIRNWNDSASWEGGNVPLFNDVTIDSGFTNIGSETTVFVEDLAQSRSIEIANTTRLEVRENGVLSVGGDSIHLDSDRSLLIAQDNGQLKLANNLTVTGLGQIALVDNATLTSLGSERSLVTFDGTRLRSGGSADDINTIRDIDLQFKNNERGGILNFDGELNIINTSITGDGEVNIVSSGNNGSIAFNSTHLENINLIANTLEGFAIGDEVNNRVLCGPFGCINSGNTNTVTWKAGESGELNLSGFGAFKVVSDNDIGLFDNTKTLVLDGQQASNTLNNDGTIVVFADSGGRFGDNFGNNVGNIRNEARLQINRDFTFSGSGEINLLQRGENNSATLKGASGVNIVNGKEHTIVGNGSIEGFATIDNQGTIYASQGELRLTNDLLINNGNLGAENGGTLFTYSKWTNDGRVYASDGGTVKNSTFIELAIATPNLSNLSVVGNTVSLTGGQWEASNGGTIDLASVYLPERYTHFENKADITIDGADSNIIVGKSLDQFGVFTNQKDGVLGLTNGASFDSASFRNFGTVNLASGTLRGLENNVGGLAQGYGVIELSSALGSNSNEFVNEGTIRAQDGELRIGAPSSGGSFINRGTVEVMGGAELIYTLNTPANAGNVFNGSGGTWAAYADDQAASLQFNQGTSLGVNAGIQELSNGTYVLSGEKANLTASYFNLSNFRNEQTDLQDSLRVVGPAATLALANKQNFVARQNINNQGQISLDEARLSGTVLSNNGKISGNGELATSILLNNNTIAASGGELSLFGIVQNTNGSIEVENTFGDVLHLENAQVFGGSVNVAENGQLNGSGGLYGAQLTNQGQIVSSDSTLEINLATGSSNSGTMLATSAASMVLQGESLQNNDGRIRADQGGQIDLQGVTVIEGAIEVIGNGSVLSGYGSLDNIALQVSEGTITANVDGQRLSITPAGVAQLMRATLQAENGGILLLSNGEFDNGGGTLIQAQDGSVVELQNVTMNGGRLESSGSGKIVEIGSSTYSDMSINANIEVADGGRFNLDGTILNSGEIIAANGGEIAMNDARLSASTLQRVTSAAGTIALQKVATDGAIKIEEGGLLKGSGRIDELSLQNEGTIHADGSNVLIFDLKGDLFVNNGNIDVTGTGGMRVMDDELVNNGVVNVESTLIVQNEFTQKAGELIVDGELAANTITIEKGSLAGSGVVDSDVVIEEEGRIKRGSLVLLEDLYLSGTLEVDMRDLNRFDALEVKGNVFFDMTTKLEFIFDASFTSFSNFSFDFLIADNFIDFDLFDSSNFIVTGLADSFDWNFNWDNRSNGISFDLTDNGSRTNVTEPSVLFLFMSSFVLLILRRNGLASTYLARLISR